MNEEIQKQLEEFRKKELSGELNLNFAKDSKGIGDTIAKITHAMGIKQCGGCKKRQEWLNKKFPYKNTLDS